MSAIIYDKAEKGREEIATRKYQLPTRLRTLLVMVDGKQTVSELLKKVSALGLTEQNIHELLDLELICTVTNLSDQPVFSLTEDKDVADPDMADTASEAAILVDIPVPANFDDDAVRFQTLYNFFNETIKSTLGLRGFNLQLKVERAASIQDFHHLRRPYIEAIYKSKGKETAVALRNRLDQMLYAGSEDIADQIIID
ncbi:hypothetical protein BH11PSE12_BH11PSE12_17160 [soil metagenome]